jgi:hypothetical protein
MGCARRFEANLELVALRRVRIFGAERRKYAFKAELKRLLCCCKRLIVGVCSIAAIRIGRKP